MTDLRSALQPGMHREGAPRRGDNAPLKLEQFLPYRLNVVASIVSQALSRMREGSASSPV